MTITQIKKMLFGGGIVFVTLLSGVLHAATIRPELVDACKRVIAVSKQSHSLGLVPTLLELAEETERALRDQTQDSTELIRRSQDLRHMTDLRDRLREIGFDALPEMPDFIALSLRDQLNLIRVLANMQNDSDLERFKTWRDMGPRRLEHLKAVLFNSSPPPARDQTWLAKRTKDIYRAFTWGRTWTRDDLQHRDVWMDRILRDSESLPATIGRHPGVVALVNHQWPEPVEDQ